MNEGKKLEIQRLTIGVFPNLKVVQAYRLFKQFKQEEYPDFSTTTVLQIIQNKPEIYSNWLNEIYMENLAMEESRFNQMVKDIKKLSFSQSKTLMSELKWHLQNWEKYPQYKK